jgi:protein SCO1/2
MAKALQILGPDAPRVQVLFVTVDPKRDTQELLRNYVPAFNPSFLGLRGDAAATARVTKDFKIYAAERPGKTPESYTVDHSAQSLVFDTKGRLRLMLAYGTPGDKIASDFRILLNS